MTRNEAASSPGQSQSGSPQVDTALAMSCPLSCSGGTSTSLHLAQRRSAETSPRACVPAQRSPAVCWIPHCALADTIEQTVLAPEHLDGRLPFTVGFEPCENDDCGAELSLLLGGSQYLVVDGCGPACTELKACEAGFDANEWDNDLFDSGAAPASTAMGVKPYRRSPGPHPPYKPRAVGGAVPPPAAAACMAAAPAYAAPADSRAAGARRATLIGMAAVGVEPAAATLGWRVVDESEAVDAWVLAARSCVFVTSTTGEEASTGSYAQLPACALGPQHDGKGFPHMPCLHPDQQHADARQRLCSSLGPRYCEPQAVVGVGPADPYGLPVHPRPHASVGGGLCKAVDVFLSLEDYGDLWREPSSGQQEEAGLCGIFAWQEPGR
ncbi:hypothetical protein HYH03_018664 [Edaphochlamys debaryana]|uniref:Uncharacterized protein n=1 Tax=Edaphochlamys debaryana TaxID=47281 RepID=A0A835XE76_9CHLO|nr:hypothetical protein HYH03_018664 [Edaphochlamys debaryana]|eukprot:KAG2482403.1 hypothetical protein HYH03_018664 [Edaphochlamys debaryana]